MRNLLLAICLLPLAGFLINGLLGRRLPKPAVHWVACGATGLSFALALAAFWQFVHQPGRALFFHYFTWIRSGDFVAEFGFLADPLAMVMLLVVTGVGFLIHVYSVGYMAHEGGYYRFFAYLNLFMFAMLLLVLADNYLLLFVGWEGVGLCSYLLIGFYFDRPAAAEAGKKAFIVNRIGDFGFVIGILLLFASFHTVSFQAVFAKVSTHARGERPRPARPDHPAPLRRRHRQERPDPALRLAARRHGGPHARVGPDPRRHHGHRRRLHGGPLQPAVRPRAGTLFWVGVIGSVTAFFAATIGLFQRDIKRVLAYSTVSQLGYMFTALGVAAFSAGIFHLMTHAFFKALLFLGSGSVIMALHHEQDMQRMGGLRKYIPVTCATMLVGTLAIAGVPFLSGFFSKDEILWKAFSSPVRGHLLFYGLATAAAVITAFYMFRLMLLTFHGESRLEPEKPHHVHESPSP